MEFNGWKNAQWKEFVIYGDTEAFLVPTDSSSSSISTTLLNNLKRNWSINDDDEDGVEENLNLDHFVDFYDETDEESSDEDDNSDIEDEDIIMTDVNSGSDCKKRIKPMPNEEPHRKRLHPWLKTKTSEPTQKKSRQDLSAFMETNSVKHEHKLVIIIFITSDFVQYFVLG